MRAAAVVAAARRSLAAVRAKVCVLECLEVVRRNETHAAAAQVLLAEITWVSCPCFLGGEEVTGESVRLRDELTAVPLFLHSG